MRKTTKPKVAFVLHPLSVREFQQKTYFYSPFQWIVRILLFLLSESFIKKIYSSLPAHKILNIRNFTLIDNKEIELIGIMCGVFPVDLIKNKDLAIKKIESAIKFAINNGAQTIVLTGFTSIALNQEKHAIFEKLKDSAHITSGNTYTAALCIFGIHRAVEMFKKRKSELTLAVIGATGDIGSICSKVLCKDFKKSVFCSRNINNDFMSLFKHDMDKIIIEKNVSKAVSCADVILISTSSHIPLIDADDVKPGAIICDVSLPYNIKNDFVKTRKDVFVFDGGKAEIKLKNVNSKWKAFTQGKAIYGCIAEGIISSLCKESISKTLVKGKIQFDDIDKAIKSANHLNISLSDFAFQGHYYTESELNEYKKVFIK